MNTLTADLTFSEPRSLLYYTYVLVYKVYIHIWAKVA